MHNIDTHTGPSFSISNRAMRLLWQIAWVIFFRYTPRTFHAWRRIVLKVFGAKIGKGVHVYPKVNIWAPWNIILDDECGIANGVTLYSQAQIFVGKRAVISQGSHLVTGTHDYNQKGFPLITKPIFISAYSWIAAEAFVHPGVTIGEGCVIGARSVVIRDQPDWQVCSGHPCLPIKARIRIVQD